MKIAIMQPYFAPYLGYFQLINEVDKFVFYDDVNYIKGGWINRNFITLEENQHRFTIPLKNSSSFKKINEIEVKWDCREMRKLEKTLLQRFKKGSPSREIIEEIFTQKPPTISELNIFSIKKICNYLGIETNLSLSSDYLFERSDDKVMNIVNMCKLEGSNIYINPIGGKKIYDKEEFLRHGIHLKFLEGNSSRSLLDIIDIKTKEDVANELKKFKVS